MSYKAIIFDLDGTLLDTIKDIAESMNIVLKRLGFPTHKTGDYYDFVGEGMEVLCKRALPPANNTPEMVKKCVAMMNTEYQRHWQNNTKPYPGIPELLNVLVKKGIKMAVLSNKPDALTKLFVEKLLPDINFSIILGASLKFPRKPAPDGALYIAASLGISPAEIIYIGDSEIDIKTAKAAGMFPVGVLWGFRSARELIQAGAKKLIKKPQEIVGIL
ncbi:MAG: HAD family hydrolase [bacterium]